MKDKVIQPIVDKMVQELMEYKQTGKYRRPFKISMPYNVETMREYSGGYNIISTMFAMKPTPVWGTFLQWKKLGYYPQSNTGVAIFSPPLGKTEVDQETGETVSSYRPPRAYYVFNACDVRDADDNQYPVDIINKDDRNVSCDIWFNQFSVVQEIKEDDQAFYRPSTNDIHMPPFETFIDSANYYSTLAHELIHWTGGETQLNRDTIAHRQSKESRAKEELIAEFGTALLCAKIGIPLDDIRTDHMEYLSSWADAIHRDESVIKDAIHEALRAVDYLGSLVSVSIE